MLSPSLILTLSPGWLKKKKPTKKEALLYLQQINLPYEEMALKMSLLTWDKKVYAPTACSD